MLTTMEIVIAVAGVVVAIVVWLLARQSGMSKLSAANEKLLQQEAHIAQLTNNCNELRLQKEQLIQQYAKTEGLLQSLTEQCNGLKKYQRDNEILNSQLILYKTKFHAAEEKLELQKSELEMIGSRFQHEFKNLAQTILEEKSARFTALNEEKMNALISPLKNQLGEFKQKVEETYDKESKERFSLGREVQRLIEMSQKVSDEANNLTSALKGNVKMQGNWGEMILESLLESSGLSKGREYHVQQFIRDNAGNIVKDENGKGLQPDITIYYPDNRKIIIDSKVSLIAWDEYIGCGNIEQQKICLGNHIRSVRLHIEGLSRKEYPRYAAALDYVLMFVPIEPAFLEAVKHDTALWKYAYDKKILMVSPTNLFAVLKIVADLWKVELQNKHALDIANKAGALYDKFEGFIGNFESVGRKIGEATSLYEEALGQLKNGKGNVMRKIEELQKNGCGYQKTIARTFARRRITDDTIASVLFWSFFNLDFSTRYLLSNIAIFTRAKHLLLKSFIK